MGQSEEVALLQRLRECIVSFDFEGIRTVAKEVLERGISPTKAIFEGMTKGMEIVGQKYELGEYFLSDLIMAGETMKEGMQILQSHMDVENKVLNAGTIVLGTVRGDIHDIGKNVVAMLLTGAGFKVFDLGVDVPAEKFLEKIKETKADILGMSALLTTTMPYMQEVIQEMVKAGIRERVKVIVGGAPLNESFAEKIGADAYAVDASAGVKICKKLVEKCGN